MSGSVEDEEYTNNIDDQLLSAAKQDVGVTHGDLEATRVKLEQIAHAAAMSERPQGQGSRPKDDIKHLSSPDRVNANLAKQFQQQQQHQAAQQAQQQAANQAAQHQAQQQAAHQAHQAHHQQQQISSGDPHLHHYDQQDVDESEYNIQIPEPIIDSKSRIYPVTENTITAEGNLITRPYPEQVFHEREDLNEFIQEFARDNGFGVVIAHSNKKAIYYTCELGGRYRHKKSKKDMDEPKVDVGNGYLLDPNTKTKKLKCPFSMTASYKKSTSVWTLRTTCNEHNHPQLDPLSNHPMLRKRSDELNLLILDLYKVGTKPSHIESKIKEQYPEVLIKREDIYNEIRGYKRKIKKQSSRFGGHGNRMVQYKKRPNGDVDDEAAVAAAAFLNGTNEDDDGNDGQNTDAQVLQYEMQHPHSQHSQEEFQRQFNQAAEVVAHQQHLDDHHYQSYEQHLQDHGLQDNDSTAAAAIAAVANVTRQHHHHNHHQHHDGSELSMDNIDSRLVGE